MKMKRMLICIGILVLTLGIVASVAIPVKAQADAFYVGFARVDINPYVIEGDLSSGLMELPLRGVGDTWNRLSKSQLLDDNGDGKIDENDGLSATCIAISDSSGNTVLMITIDLIGGDKASMVKTEICARVEEAIASGELTDVNLSADQIYYAGTHTHNAPDISVYSASGKTGFNNEGKDLSVVNENLGLWINRTVKYLGDASIRALKDRSEATLTKYAIDASEDTRAPVSGRVMNTVRHYNNFDSAGNLVCVGGDNFNTRGNNPKAVTEVDDTLYMMYFDFSEYNRNTGDNKLPIIVANWRGHPSLNNSDSSYFGGKRVISSDYVNAFCHALEYNCTVDNNGKGYYGSKQMYRVAFFQGAGGNVNPRCQEKVGGVYAYKWIDELSNKNKECRGNSYGRILCALAKHGLRDGEPVSPGPIKTMSYQFSTSRKTIGVTALSYEAGVAYQADPSVSLPFAYKNAEGQTYVIGSKYHANAIVSRWNASLQKGVDSPASMTLSAIMIGEGMALVTVPGEPFDYYYNEDDTNAWDNLINQATYGKPWILSLCNGMNGYVPNNKAYTYNEGSTKWTTGSYESHTSPFEVGTGEKMIDVFSVMLAAMEEGTHEIRYSFCEHCGKEVDWTYYIGQNKLDSGHYYLLMDTYVEQIQINKEQQVCFDLNGYTIQGNTRVFYTSAKGKSVLSIMDSSSKQTGQVLGAGGQLGAAGGFGGGAIIVDSANTLNLYSGSIGLFEKKLYSLWRGGTMHVSGTFNMYGGKVLGGQVASFSGSYLSGSNVVEKTRVAGGGTIYLSGNLNMYGGRICGGTVLNIFGTVETNADGSKVYNQTVTKADQVGYCIYSTGKVKLAGDAVIDDVYYAGNSANAFSVDTVDGAFTGKVQLSFQTPIPDIPVIGKCTENTVLEEGSVTVSNGDIAVEVKDGQLYAFSEAATVASDGSLYYYKRFADALNACAAAPGGYYLRLTADMVKPVVISANTVLDLSGFSIQGDLTVNSGSVLYCMDSKTDISSSATHGMIRGNVNGVVLAKPANMPDEIGPFAQLDGAGYWMLRQADGVSFHRMHMQLTNVSLRPSQAGLYYTASFGSDPVLAEQITEFGIVVNAYRAPHEEASVTEGGNICVQYSADRWTHAQYTGAMVSGIMKAENSGTVNAEHAARPIYACTYVLLKDGTYCYGDTVCWSLQQMLEAADAANLIGGSAIEALRDMYTKYASVMEKWQIPNLRSQLAA